MNYPPEVWQSIAFVQEIVPFACLRFDLVYAFLAAHVVKGTVGERGEITCSREQEFLMDLFNEIRRSDPGFDFLQVPLWRGNGGGPGMESRRLGYLREVKRHRWR